MSENPEMVLLSFINDEVAIGPDPVELDTDLLLTGLVDSLGVVRIVHEIEEVFGIEVPPEAVTIDNFRSVADMVRWVEARRTA